jgi:hypothetical protein
LPLRAGPAEVSVMLVKEDSGEQMPFTEFD